MPKECEKYRLQLVMEYNRVLAWGKAAGLVDVPEGSTLAITLGTDSIELVAIVARIQWLLEEFRDLNARYSKELPPMSGDDTKAIQRPFIVNRQSTDADILKAVSSLAVSYEARKRERMHLRGINHLRKFLEKAGRHAKEIASHPVRIRWVAVDKEAFEALLKDLHVLTERLHELMGTYRQKRIDDITAKTYREMILARNDIQDLKDMFDAVTSLMSMPADIRANKDARLNIKMLQDLVQLKKISRTSESILSQLKRDSTFDVYNCLPKLGVTVRKYTDSDLSEDFEWNEADEDNPPMLHRPRGVLKTDKGDIPVWIEWRSLDDTPPNSIRDKESALRTLALAEMLHLPKPASLHAPECVGYFDDREVSGAERYGWIFRMPNGSDHETRVVSLYNLLGNSRFRPSLSQRVAMAFRLCMTVLNLHAVNWLHKGIFSDNVIFHFNDGGGGGASDSGRLRYDPEKLLLSGFEFSRPDGMCTTARDADVLWDLYRWPPIQREQPTERNSKKTYDLYSLGLVLLEIAHWEKLERLMHLREASVPLEESKAVRDWLLGIRRGAPFEAVGSPNPLDELRNIAGDKYWKVVKRCLWAHGDRGFGVMELADQSNDSRVGMLLQEMFTEHVVEVLSSIEL